MKRINPVVAFLLFATALFTMTSCGKEVSSEPNYHPNGSNSGSGASSGTFKAKVNGGSWIAASDKQSATILSGVINVTGISSSGQMILITLKGDTVGTYGVSYNGGEGAVAYQPNSGNAAVTYSSNASDDENLAGGKVIITSIDKDKKVIKGTFTVKVFYNGDGTSYDITEGSFELTYATTIPTTPGTGTPGNPSSSGTYLKATLDGAAWEATSVTGFASLGQIMVNGTVSDVSKTVGITIPDNIAVGSYTFVEFGDYMALYNVGKDINSIVTYVSASGTLKITEHNKSTKKITGTFDFKGEVFGDPTKTANITSGSFSVTYQ